MLSLVNPLKYREKSKVHEAMTAIPLPPRNVLALAAALVVAAGIGVAGADGMPPAGNADEEAARLVEEVLRGAGGNGADSLGEWTRDVIDRALERAGEDARRTAPGSGSGAGPGSPGGTTVPLPAERHAASLAADRTNTAEILIFTSLSVPAASWRQWAREAASMGAAEHAGPPLVLRGVGEGGLRQTVKEIGARLGGAEAGVAIDPRLFRLFGVTRVPAVVVVPGGVAPCRSRGCADDPAPPHDRVAGNIGLVAALEAVADEGAVGREVAKAYLERLGREQ